MRRCDKNNVAEMRAYVHEGKVRHKCLLQKSIRDVGERGRDREDGMRYL